MQCNTFDEVKSALSKYGDLTKLHNGETVACVLLRPGVIGFDCYSHEEAGDHTRNYGDFSCLEIHKVKDLLVLFSNLVDVKLHLPVYIRECGSGTMSDPSFVHLSHYRE